jgi:hypothetical protein
MLLTEMSAYSNAVQQYGKDAADFWSQYDFSPTKRYVKKMCDLFYKDKIPQNEITKIFRGYQENAEWFDEMGVDFNKLTWEQLKELVLKQIGEYDNVSQLPNQFYISDDGLITIGYFNTFEEAMNFEPQNGWCTSVNQGRFEEHHDINHEMLYIIRNNKLSKGSNCRFVVAQVNLDGSIVYWDQKNNNLNDGGGHISASEYETSLGDAKNKLQPMKSNNQLNCNLNMNKKLIRLTESDLHRIVKESINRVMLKEWFGMEGEAVEGWIDLAKDLYTRLNWVRYGIGEYLNTMDTQFHSQPYNQHMLKSLEYIKMAEKEMKQAVQDFTNGSKQPSDQL